MFGQIHHGSAARCTRFVRQGASLVIAAGLSAGLSAVMGCDRPVSPAPETTPTAQDTVQRAKPARESGPVLPAARTLADLPLGSTGTLTDSPPVRVVPPMLDFGFIAPNQDANGSVKIFNTGTEPLMILAAEPSCKCTTLNDISGTVIPPGGSVDLEAKLDGASNTGPKTASIKVLFDGYSVVHVVDLKAEIALPIRAIPPHINAVRNQNRQGRIVVESIDGEPFSICSIHGLPPTFLGFDKATDTPRSQYILTYDLDTIPTPYPRYLVIETDRPDTPMVDVYLRHETTLPKPNRNLRMFGGFRFPLGLIKQGGHADLEVTFDTVAQPIATVISETSDCRAELLGTRTEESDKGLITTLMIRVTPASDYVGVLYAPLSAMTTGGEVASFNVFGIVSPDGEPCVGPTVEPVSPATAGEATVKPVG
ncbi:MAG: DUF1573 domain-containing protein [Planctomycetota bacterium]|nr:DUF1573 domain-containing protein [Planctomycetota bacterium]MDA1027401.1 DUF1573 domain-containing protein [Planctomycetota bacterium]